MAEARIHFLGSNPAVEIAGEVSIQAEGLGLDGGVVDAESGYLAARSSEARVKSLHVRYLEYSPRYQYH